MMRWIKEWAGKYIADTQYFVLCLVLVCGLACVYFFGKILIPVFAALIIAFILEGLIVQLIRFGCPRFVALFIVFLIFLVCFIIMLLWLYPLLSRQMVQLFQQVPAMLLKAKAQLMALPQQYPEIVTTSQIQELYNFISSGLSDFARRALMASLSSVKGMVALIVYLVVIPFLVFFFLKDKEKILIWLALLFPKDNDLAESVWEKVNTQMTNYIRGKGWEILVIWAVTFSAYFFVGLQYALLLSFLAGISVILPYIGVIIVFIPTLIISYFQFGWEALFLWSTGAYVLIQLIDAHILAPLLFSEVTNLHPVAIVISVLFFGGIWGGWGLFFSIPLATIINVLIDTWLARRMVSDKSET